METWTRTRGSSVSAERPQRSDLTSNRYPPRQMGSIFSYIITTVGGVKQAIVMRQIMIRFSHHGRLRIIDPVRHKIVLAVLSIQDQKGDVPAGIMDVSL